MLLLLFGVLDTAQANPLTGDSLHYLSAKDTVFLQFNAWEEKVFLHRLERKQTLYSLAQFYGLKLEELYRYNPGLLDNPAPDVGTEVQVPIPNRSILRYPGPNFKRAEHAPVFYVVRKGDTLYRISKGYFQMPIDTLMARNQLIGVNLKEGQLLHVGWMSTSGVERGDAKGGVGGSAGALSLEQAYRSQIEAGKKEVKHQGAAFWDKETHQSARPEYIALHRAAALNSVIAITNPMTSRTIYARVIGSIPDHYGSHIQVVLPASTASFLGALDDTFFVQLRYCH